MIVNVLKRALRSKPVDLPLTGAADARWSVISSASDLYTEPNDGLVEILLAAAQRARSVHLPDLEARSGPDDAQWVRQWPGEHYRLLTALVAELAPSTVIEIGTFKGQGAIALSAGNPNAQVITYDIVPWRDFPDTALRERDISSGRVEQRLGDLGDTRFLDQQEATLRSADLLFIDGPKDGHWEQHACPAILDRLTDRRRLIVFDDIRLIEMVQLWRDLPYPKLDATSLGHWSGTGLLHTA